VLERWSPTYDRLCVYYASHEQVAHQFAVNVFGTMDVTRAVLPTMRAQRRGVIANITSGAGVFGLPMSALYSASKFAVEGFSEGLMYELAALGIVVKLIEPGGVLDTRFTERSARSSTMASIADYGPFLASAAEVYGKLQTDRAGATSDDVAEVIFGAVTDGSDRLRYVATPQIEPLVELRRRAGEDAYLAALRSQFGYRLER